MTWMSLRCVPKLLRVFFNERRTLDIRVYGSSINPNLSFCQQTLTAYTNVLRSESTTLSIDFVNANEAPKRGTLLIEHTKAALQNTTNGSHGAFGTRKEAYFPRTMMAPMGAGDISLQ